MKHKLNKIIAAVLTLAIALTGVLLGDTTAYASDFKNVIIVTGDNTSLELLKPGDKISDKDIRDTTVTMKPGDRITVQLIKTNVDYDGGDSWYPRTHYYEWTSSDESVASLYREYDIYHTGMIELCAVTVIAEKEGTATITADNDGYKHSFTVVVKKPAMTAKQKSCKHAWKTTKKATCMRKGVKTCKKCKLQKDIKKKAHKFVTKSETYIKYATQYPIYVCGACTCVDPETGEPLHHWKSEGGCNTICGEIFDATNYDVNGNGHIDKEDVEAAEAAYRAHKVENNHGTGDTEWQEAYADPYEVTEKVTRCKTCNRTKEQIKNAGQ